MYAGIIFYNDTPEMLAECLLALKSCQITTIAIDGAFKEFLACDKTGKLKPHSTDGCIDIAKQHADYYIPASPWCWESQAQKRSAYLHVIPEKSQLMVIDADEILQTGHIEKNEWADIMRVLLIPENFSSVRIYRVNQYLRYLYRHCSLYNLTMHISGNLDTGALVQAHKSTNALLPMLHYTNGSPVTFMHKKADRSAERKELKNVFYGSRKETYYQEAEEGTAAVNVSPDRKKIIGAIATMYSRRDFLVKTVESIVNQVDTLYICFNDYRHYRQIPAEIQQYKNVVPLLPEKDYGSIGRFIWNNDPDAYYCMMDDDLIYPPDYVKYLIAGSVKYENKAVITLHGKKYTTARPQNWRQDVEKNFPCLDTVTEDNYVHVGGTGAMLFDGLLVNITEKNFKNLLYDDIEFSILMQQKKIPIVVIKHDAGYLQYQDVGSETIWEWTTRNQAMSEDLNRLVQSIEWSIYD